MPTLRTVINDLQEQWDLLQQWLGELPDNAVADPVTPIGQTFAALSALQVVTLSPEDEPLTLSEYLAVAQRSGWATPSGAQVPASVAQVDEIAESALLNLDELLANAAGDRQDMVVSSTHGPILLVDALLNALIKLVVRGYDVAPLLPLPVPVDPTARTLVAQALIDVVRMRTGYRLDVDDEAAWIKAAAGKIDWATAVAADAVRPSALSDGTPDLAPSLPLV